MSGLARIALAASISPSVSFGGRLPVRPAIDGDTAGPAEEEVMKADALMRFILSGNRSLEEFAVLLVRISLGVFFAISGGNKLFLASQYRLMYETIVACVSG